jgi:large subunit ribosomal protein L6
VGYRASVSGAKLELSLGYSHPVLFDVPKGIEVKVDKQTTVLVTGADKALVGQVAAKIRGFRPPEPYLGKGVRYTDEKLRRKEGKSAGK